MTMAPSITSLRQRARVLYKAHNETTHTRAVENSLALVPVSSHGHSSVGGSHSHSQRSTRRHGAPPVQNVGQGRGADHARTKEERNEARTSVYPQRGVVNRSPSSRRAARTRWPIPIVVGLATGPKWLASRVEESVEPEQPVQFTSRAHKEGKGEERKRSQVPIRSSGEWRPLVIKSRRATQSGSPIPATTTRLCPGRRVGASRSLRKRRGLHWTPA